MPNALLNLIQVVGIADPSTFPTAPTTFTQIAVAETLTIPDAKPAAEQITTVLVDAEITSTRVIQTPIGTSLEGQILTGFKLAVEGSIRQKILYVANELDQPVHAAEFAVPFSTFIALPPVIGTIPIIDLAGSIEVTPFIEDVYVELTSPRTVFKNVVLFLNAALPVLGP